MICRSAAPRDAHAAIAPRRAEVRAPRDARAFIFIFRRVRAIARAAAARLSRRKDVCRSSAASLLTRRR